MVDRRAPVARDAVVSRVAAHRPATRDEADLRAAAVLVPLVQRGDSLHLVFTLRRAHLASHAGQVSFPGGRVEPDDGDRWHTALREADEELAIPASAVEPVGRLDDYTSFSRYHITPCVGLVDPTVRMRPCPHEVADVFTVPLERLLDPAARRTMRARHLRAAEERVFFYLTRPHVVWGVTGAIVANLVEVLGGAPAGARGAGPVQSKNTSSV